jgi:hypothetical protein
MRASRRAARRGPLVTTTVVTTAVTVAALAGPVLAGPVLAGSVGPTGAGGATGAGGVPGHGILPPQAPTRDVSPSPDFLAARSCAGGGDSAACNALVLHAIGHARKVLEKIGGLSLSLAAYEKLTPDEQLFVSANAERVERGLPAIAALTRSLDQVAQAGANADADPPLDQVPGTLPGGGRWVSLGGNWAGGYDNALGADYGWMYADRGSGWGHRDNILGSYVSSSACGGRHHEIVMGAGHVTRGKAYGDSETELFAGVCGALPTDVVLTWARAKRFLHVG